MLHRVASSVLAECKAGTGSALLTESRGHSASANALHGEGIAACASRADADCEIL